MSDRQVAEALGVAVDYVRALMATLAKKWTSPRMVDTQLRVYTHPWRSIMARTRRAYTSEFKAEAVKLVTEQGYSVAQAARSLGITDHLIRNWKQALEAQGDQPFPG